MYRTETRRFLEHVLQQKAAKSAASELRTNGKVVDVDLVRNSPERAETGDPLLFSASHEHVANIRPL